MSKVANNSTDQAAIILQLRQKITELENDLEHVIEQCKLLASAKSTSAWINRNEPKLDNK